MVEAYYRRDFPSPVADRRSPDLSGHPRSDGATDRCTLDTHLVRSVKASIGSSAAAVMVLLVKFCTDYIYRWVNPVVPDGASSRRPIMVMVMVCGTVAAIVQLRRDGHGLIGPDAVSNTKNRRWLARSTRG